MIKTIKNQKGVIGVTSLARNLNSLIGNYQEHFINENFGYTVKLSNGGLKMSSEIAQDFEIQPNIITTARVQPVANSYWKIDK